MSEQEVRDIPECLGASGLVRASSIAHFDRCARLVPDLLSVDGPGVTFAYRVGWKGRRRRSPRCGSLNIWHQMSSITGEDAHAQQVWSRIQFVVPCVSDGFSAPAPMPMALIISVSRRSGSLRASRAHRRRLSACRG